MVLDAKAMTWASQNGIDTPTLKRLKIPIYGKWYFPELPANVPLVNLDNGHIQTFKTAMRAGEILYVARDDLRRARLGPYSVLPDPAPAPAEEPPGSAAARLAEQRPPRRPVEVIPPGIHLPSPSIFPLVLGIGISIMLLGLVAGPFPLRIMVMLLGLVWSVVAGIGWAVENQRDRDAHHATAEHEAGAAEETRQ